MPPSSSSSSFAPPSTLLIIGSGAFGLSTAHALSLDPLWSSTHIRLVHRSPGAFTSPEASSIDSSRIIRADYADPFYAALASAAQAEWRKPGPDSIGGEGRYTETGFLVCADDAPSWTPEGKRTGMGFAREAWANARRLTEEDGTENVVRELRDRDAIKAASGTGAGFGDWGYLNRGSGWADAEKSMKWLYRKVVDMGRVELVSAAVERLEVDAQRKQVIGARLADGRSIRADLVVVAAGAWTPSLVNLRGQAVATGQCLGYMDITEEEQEKLEKIPVLMNLTRGTFLITPSNRVLKIGRHAYGYQNPKKITTALTVPKDEGDPVFPEITVSQPYTHLDDPELRIPAEGELALREALRQMVPWQAVRDRSWTRTRLCWYTDTATGDFLIDYHPYWTGLFIATGGSGHGFKYLPVLGGRIADRIMKRSPVGFESKWKWREATDVEKNIVTEDGSRGGRLGLLLHDEIQKSGGRM